MEIRKILLFGIVAISCLCGPGCNNDDDSGCPAGDLILDTFSTDREYIISTEGKVYVRENGSCSFLLDYFSPSFSQNYYERNGEILISANDLEITTIKSLTEDFESAATYQDIFVLSPETITHNWTDVTLQSPKKPTIAEYVALRKCLFANTCDFVDNRIDIVDNMATHTGQSLRFTAVAPTQQMVTSKASIENTLCHADVNDEITVEADVFIESGFPFSLIDIENKWFDESPGIRLVFRNGNQLAMELKYGAKPMFIQSPGQEVNFPTEKWVRIKLRVTLKSDLSGSVRVWQDDQLIIDQTGKTLPTSNSIQTNLEVGITATSQSAVVYMDNISLSTVRQ